jgi:hypothetical protein
MMLLTDSRHRMHAEKLGRRFVGHGFSGNGLGTGYDMTRDDVFATSQYHNTKTNPSQPPLRTTGGKEIACSGTCILLFLRTKH